MTDRKQVIWDIERCTCHVPDACRDCSHYQNGEAAISCMEKLLADALVLLREQETVEPVVHCKDANLSNGADFACSGCGGSFLHKVVNFCPWCGKKVKWG